MCELLQPHLMQFYEPNASLEAPLRLENCVAEAGGGGVRAVEPLPHLLRCVRRVMASAPPGEGDDDMEADDIRALQRVKALRLERLAVVTA